MINLEKKGGEHVTSGTYWNSLTGEKIRLESDGRLPGDESNGYLRFHPAALLVLGPLLGLAYVIFLPLIGILMLIWLVGGRAFEILAEGFRKVAVFSWEPGYAYLTGKKQKPAKRKPRKSSAQKDKDENSDSSGDA